MAKSNATPRNPRRSTTRSRQPRGTQKRRVNRSRQTAKRQRRARRNVDAGPTAGRARNTAPKAFGVAVPAGLKLPPGISVKKSRHVLDGAGDVSFDITAKPGSDVLASLVANTPFPRRKIDVTELSVGVTAGRPFQLDGGKGKVAFTGSASGYERLTVLDDPAEIVALLVRDNVNDEIANGLAITRAPNHRYVFLRWGYDLQGAAKGSVALGFGPAVTFGAEARRLGAFAVLRQVPSDLGALSALKSVFDSWMLPSQFRKLDDVDPGTWIVAEVDGSFALTLGAQYGYDFNWVREAVQLGGLSGDIGLKVQLGVSASFGFEASGQYAIALSRPLSGQILRLQLFRLSRKGLNVAFAARASAQGSFGGLLPDHFDEFVEGVFGLHGLQILKELDKWTDPDEQLSDLLAGVGVDYAADFLGKVTGIDPKTRFEAARARLVGLLEAWQALPPRVAATVYSIVEHEVSGVPALKSQLERVATSDLATFQPEAEQLLAHVDFFKTPFGKWLESAAFTSVLAAVSDKSEYARVQQIAKQTLAVLDGSLLEPTLVSLQQELEQRVGLKRLEQIVDKASFDKADEWLKARLSTFLAKKIDLPQVLEIRTAVHRLLALREKFFQQARTALTKKYEFQLLATYQKAATDTALVDVVFDFDAEGGSSGQLVKLATAAIDGDFEQVLVQDILGVSLKQAALTHGIERQTHLELTMPFLHTEIDHITKSLAKVEAIDSDRGRILLYDLHADDLKTARGKFASRFAVQGQFAQQSGVRIFDETSLTHSYTFREAVPKMRRRALEAQLGTYGETYFPQAFGAGEASLSTWISDLDRTLDTVLNNGPDNFGNTLLTLELSAPAALVGAWALAPAAEKADEYFRMSKAIQGALRKLIPLCHFHNLDRFKDRIPSAALLVYAAMPEATGIVVDDGRIVAFDDRRDIYWDIDTKGNVEAMARNLRTVAALQAALRSINDTLIHAEGMTGVAADYHPSRTSRVVDNALTTDVGAADLRNLLLLERMVVREARQAGMRIAAFLQARNTLEARRRLSEYGAKVTDAFNSTIGGLFSGRELRSLGTLVFLEAARAFDPSLKGGRPSAMLELTVLREKPSFDMRSFVEGAEVPQADVVRAEKFVALA